MLNEEFIKDHYGSMTEEQLIELVEEGSQDLRPEAWTLLKKEFRARGLSMSYFEPKPEPVTTAVTETAEEPFYFSGISNSIIGTRTEDVVPFPENKEEEKEPGEYPASTLQELIRQCDSEAKKNGVIAVIGIAITLATYEMAANGGTYFVAWGAILFGGARFVTALTRKNKYEAALKEKETVNEEKPAQTDIP